MVTFWDGNTLAQLSSVVCLKAAVLAVAASPDFTTLYVSGEHVSGYLLLSSLLTSNIGTIIVCSIGVIIVSTDQ